jgi:hypothetical protein
VRATAIGKISYAGFNPPFKVRGTSVVLHPLEIVSFPVDQLGACVGSLSGERAANFPISQNRFASSQLAMRTRRHIRSFAYRVRRRPINDSNCLNRSLATRKATPNDMTNISNPLMACPLMVKPKIQAVVGKKLLVTSQTRHLLSNRLHKKNYHGGGRTRSVNRRTKRVSQGTLDCQ